ncbi:hypothetical protein [Pseudomonas sp. R5(2019)]|uniref:hypothetical protein n=1 Tax=Pseudomonas sp. R5(2019) TaxID=2697566 RepID=UPI0014126628|nr:hypothetical protein [Pseudomonas sp. R5(2019)]NBA97948.1 hypothetical protein [Pseudomonas sp. R5(2019)]
MHIQVITGAGRDGATRRLRYVKELQDWFGEANKTVHAEAYGAAGLIEILEVRAADGQREILVLECSVEQIQAALEWQSETDEVVELENLVLHLVRKIPSEQSAG